MKKLLFLLFILFSHLSLQADVAKKPTVCLNMIVKNEKDVIRRCLESVKPLIDTWVIVDTGSTDGTQEIIKEFMKDIPGELFERPWKNFAHNRNEALSLAKNRADYLLFIDADDKFDIVKGYSRPKLSKDCYQIRIDYSGSTYYRTQLISTRLPWKWVGVVHEVLVCDEMTTMGNLDGVTMVIVGGGDRSQDPKKFEKDALVLEKALLEEPGNARYTFYLAQSYRDAGQLKKAQEVYERRVALGGWDEEVFWSLYQIAELQEWLNMPEETIRNSYLKAYRYRPSRAEPLYRLAAYYRLKGDYFNGYLYSQFAMRMKQPNDVLFVESWIYDFGALLEFSICAYWIDHFLEANDASNMLLANKKLPDNVRECVQNNLKFVIPKIASEAKKSMIKKVG